MKKFKKYVATLLFSVTLIPSFNIKTYAKSPVKWPSGPEILAESAYVMDIDTGTCLYEKNADDQKHPASITKILTLLIAAEKGKLKDTVTFSKEAIAGNETRSSSHIARDVGEKMSLDDCMYAMMLASANECADAIAEHIGGTKEKFVEMMNKKAKELGCKNSNFVCSNGFTDEGHYVTAKDMAIISAEAYKNPVAKKYICAKKHTIPPTNVHEEPTYLINHHDMLIPYRTGKYVYKYCTGGKTGYTDIAKNTLVTYAEKDGKRLVCVVLKDEIPYQKYRDTKDLLDFAFDNYSHFDVNSILDLTKDKEAKRIFKTKNMKELSLDTAFVTLPNSANINDVEFTYEAQKRKKGSAVVGKVSYKYGKIHLGKTTILNKAELKREIANDKASKKAAIEKAKRARIFVIVAVIIFVIVIFGVTAVYFFLRWKNQRKWNDRKLF